MTNATVADAVTGVNGRTVTVSYNGEEKKLEIPEGTPVVTYAPATQADLKPKAIVFILAEKGTDGAISTAMSSSAPTASSHRCESRAADRAAPV